MADVPALVIVVMAMPETAPVTVTSTPVAYGVEPSGTYRMARIRPLTIGVRPVPLPLASTVIETSWRSIYIAPYEIVMASNTEHDARTNQFVPSHSNSARSPATDLLSTNVSVPSP